MSKPVRLHKVQEPTHYDSVMDWIENWMIRHATLCLIVLSCLLMALFVTVIFLLVGVSATDSGIVYNQMEAII